MSATNFPFPGERRGSRRGSWERRFSSERRGSEERRGSAASSIMSADRRDSTSSSIMTTITHQDFLP